MKLLHRGIETEIRDVDREERTFVAVASTKNPVYGQSLLPESWDFTRFRKNPVMPMSHIYRVEPRAGNIPVVGKSLWEKIQKDNLLFKPQFVNKEFAQDLFDLYADKYMRAFSVGYMMRTLVFPEDARFDELKKKHALGDETEVISIDTLLFEISPVVLPADEDALTQALSEDRIHSRALRDAIEGEFEGRNTFSEAMLMQKEYMDELRGAMDVVAREIDVLQEIVRSYMKQRNEEDGSGERQTEMSVPPFPLGISGAALAEQVGQAVAGEIRRMQGKVE